MSNDLLTRVADKLRADAQFGYGNPDMQLIRDLAARVRELQAERSEWEAEVGRRASVWQERAERAEAERDALAAAMPSEGADAAIGYAHMKAERDALRGFLAGLCVKLNDARLGHDWLEVSNAECAITEVIDAALGEKP